MSDGTRKSPIAEYPDVWVQFKASGYPFSLTRTLDKSKDALETMRIVLSYVIAWNMTDIEGRVIELPVNGARGPEILDNVDEALTTWVIKAFYENRAEIIKAKNSLPPSPSTS